MRLPVLVLLALAFPGVSLGATGQSAGKPVVSVHWIPSGVPFCMDGTTCNASIRWDGTYLLPSKSFGMTNATSATTPLIQINQHATTPEVYGIDIKAYADNPAAPTPGTGANTGLVIHHYSAKGPALWIDNVRNTPFIKLANEHNDSQAAGQYGSGYFLDLFGYTTSSPTVQLQLGSLLPDLTFLGRVADTPWKFQAGDNIDSLRVLKFASGYALNVAKSATGTSATVNIEAAQATGPALRLVQSGAGLGVSLDQEGAANGLYVLQNGNGTGIKVDQNAAQSALYMTQAGGAIGAQIITTSGAAGFYPLLVSGQDYGPKFITSTNGGAALIVDKEGTGSGSALSVINKGTGVSLSLSNGTSVVSQSVGAAAPTTGVHAVGEIVWNTAPAASGKIGWVCVGAGTPGTWKAFGAIDP